jgi:endogenous inhibitor of DNA gyrase (YacG/DUF329 family)
MSDDKANHVQRPPAACPTCGKPVVQAYRPFCSKRCADVDLQRWLTGRYAIPVEESGEGAADEDGAGQDPHGSL